jgi:hypothetical protein
MQPHYWKGLTGLGVFLLLWLGAAALHAEDTRNPFRMPEQRINPYNYGRAIRMVTLKGIVRTEGFKICLTRVGDMETLAVLRPGDRVSLDHEGLAHRFTVSDILEKSVVFADKEGRIYEVPIQ